MALEPGTSILVAQKQLHGNSSIISQGELIEVRGNQAVVTLKDIAVPITVDLASVTAADPLLGPMTGRPNEHAVIDRLPR